LLQAKLAGGPITFIENDKKYVICDNVIIPYPVFIVISMYLVWMLHNRKTNQQHYLISKISAKDIKKYNPSMFRYTKLKHINFKILNLFNDYFLKYNQDELIKMLVDLSR
jgi:hypothetical protein